jgi:hypothetical protein
MKKEMAMDDDEKPAKTQQEFYKALIVHARRAEDFDPRPLKELVAVPSPNGGYRMERRIIGPRALDK